MKKILVYCMVAYSFTWIVLFGIYFLFLSNVISRDVMNLLYNFGALGPLLGALLTTYYFYGKTGVKNLFTKIPVTIPNKMTLLVLLSPVILMVLGLILYPVLSGNIYTFHVTKEQFHLYSPFAVAGWILPFIVYAICEEFGWRGFLLPHLQSKYSAFVATVLLWIIWSAWHIPMFFSRFEFSTETSIGFLIGIFVGSLLLTFLFNSSRGSLGVVILFHFLNNIASALDHTYIVAAVSTGYMILAVCILLKFKLTNLSSEEKFIKI